MSEAPDLSAWPQTKPDFRLCGHDGRYTGLVKVVRVLIALAFVSVVLDCLALLGVDSPLVRGGTLGQDAVTLVGLLVLHTWLRVRSRIRIDFRPEGFQPFARGHVAVRLPYERLAHLEFVPPARIGLRFGLSEALWIRADRRRLAEDHFDRVVEYVKEQVPDHLFSILESGYTHYSIPWCLADLEPGASGVAVTESVLDLEFKHLGQSGMPTAVVVGGRKFEVRKEGASIHLMASGGASVPLLVIDENLVLFSNGMVVASVRREATVAELHFGSGEVVVLRPETGELRLQGLSEGECRGEMRAQHGARGCLLTKFECPVPELLAAVLPLVAFFHAPRFVRQPRNLALRELDRRADVG